MFLQQISLWVFALSFLFLTSCNNSAENTGENPDQYPVYTITSIDTLVERAFVAHIEARRNVEIRSRVSGYLERVLVDEGQFVKEGQVLFQLNEAPFRLALEKAEASYRSALAEVKAAQVEVDRLKSLLAKNIVSPTEVHLAEAKVQVQQARSMEAMASLDEARLMLKFCKITSPFSGTIDRLPLRLGSLVESGTLLTSLSDVEEVFAYFPVSENDYLAWGRNDSGDPAESKSKVKLNTADGHTYPYDGRIETMEGEIDRNTGSIAFRARFKNPEKLLKHGSSGKVRLSRTLKKALMIPQKAVFEVQDKNFVFVVQKDSSLQLRAFSPLMRLGGLYVVESGLNTGETIVIEGTQNLKEGQRISPVVKSRAVAFSNSFKR